MTQKTYFKISLLLLFCSLLNLRAFAQNENIGFELGNTTNWICGIGTYGDIHEKSCTPSKLPFIIAFDGICMNQGGMDGSNAPINGATNRHTIMSTGSDPNSFNHISCVAPANLFPSNTNKYSFRLGNTRTIEPVGSINDSLAYTEGIAFKLSVDSSNSKLTYLYAAFINRPNPVHSKVESPRFIVKIVDSKDSLVKDSYKEITGEDAIFKRRICQRNRYLEIYGLDKNFTGFINLYRTNVNHYLYDRRLLCRSKELVRFYSMLVSTGCSLRLCIS